MRLYEILKQQVYKSINGGYKTIHDIPESSKMTQGTVYYLDYYKDGQRLQTRPCAMTFRDFMQANWQIASPEELSMLKETSDLVKWINQPKKK